MVMPQKLPAAFAWNYKLNLVEKNGKCKCKKNCCLITMCKAHYSKVTYKTANNIFISSRAVDIIRTVYYIHCPWGNENMTFSAHVKKHDCCLILHSMMLTHVQWSETFWYTVWCNIPFWLTLCKNMELGQDLQTCCNIFSALWSIFYGPPCIAVFRRTHKK